MNPLLAHTPHCIPLCGIFICINLLVLITQEFAYDFTTAVQSTAVVIRSTSLCMYLCCYLNLASDWSKQGHPCRFLENGSMLSFLRTCNNVSCAFFLVKQTCTMLSHTAMVYISLYFLSFVCLKPPLSLVISIPNTILLFLFFS